MNNKILGLFLLTVIASLALASAGDLSLTFVSPSSVSQNQGTATITFNLTNNNLTFLASPLAISGTSNIGTLGSWSVPASITSLSTSQVTGVLTFPANQVGPITLTINGNGTINGLLVPFSLSPLIQITPSYSFSMTSTSTALNSSNAASINITNTGNLALTIALTIQNGAINNIANNVINNLQPGASQIVTIQGSGSNVNKVTLTATPQGTNVPPAQSIVFLAPFCKGGVTTNGNLSVTDFTVRSTSDSSGETWKPLDNVIINVQVTNNGVSDIKKVKVVLALFDSNGNNKAGSLDFINQLDNQNDNQIDLGRLNSGGSEKRARFEFNVPGDLKDGSYKLDAKAYNSDVGELNDCTDTVGTSNEQSVSLELEDADSKLIAFDNLLLSQDTATCGDTLTMNLDAWNVGTDSQDRVRVNLDNTALHLSESQEIINGLDGQSSQPMTFTFTIPQNIPDGNYPIQVSADYKYSNGAYHQTESGQIQRMPLKISGCIVTSQVSQDASITATLNTAAVAGQEIIVKATIKNTGQSTTSYTVLTSGIESFSTLEKIDPQTFTLDAGQSKDVLIYLKANSGASGDYTFNINAAFGSKTKTQPVSLTVQSQSNMFSGLGQSLKTNWLIWVIVLVNIILIVLIIVIAVRIVKR